MTLQFNIRRLYPTPRHHHQDVDGAHSIGGGMWKINGGYKWENSSTTFYIGDFLKNSSQSEGDSCHILACYGLYQQSVSLDCGDNAFRHQSLRRVTVEGVIDNIPHQSSVTSVQETEYVKKNSEDDSVCEDPFDKVDEPEFRTLTPIKPLYGMPSGLGMTGLIRPRVELIPNVGTLSRYSPEVPTREENQEKLYNIIRAELFDSQKGGSKNKARDLRISRSRLMRLED